MMRGFLALSSLGLLFWGCTTGPVDREVVATTAAPAAIGPYSQAVRAGSTLYLAGQIAIDPETGEFVQGGIREQTRQVLENIRSVLQAAGYSMGDVVQSQVFLSDLENYAAMNTVYATYFEEAPPARAAVEVARLPKDALVEILVTAVK